MDITENFTLEEMCSSNTAHLNGIDNSTNDVAQIIALTKLCVNVLQPVREHFAEPVVISSGFRCKELNKKLGGVRNSQHMLGQAADIYLDCDTKKETEYFQWIRKNIDYDQLILEGNEKTSWIHVSYNSKSKNRHKSWMQLKKTSGA